MIHGTTSGLSFQLKEGGIDDRIEDGCHYQSFNNKYARWETTSIDEKLWYNYGSMTCN
jgi:hypothetical protein